MPFAAIFANFLFMSRPLRIEFAGALYQLTSRGDGREAIFLDDADRRLFLDVKQQRLAKDQT